MIGWTMLTVAAGVAGYLIAHGYWWPAIIVGLCWVIGPLGTRCGI